MGKVRSAFVCRSCGGVQARWVGKCPDCGAWDALEEHRTGPDLERDPRRVPGWSPEDLGGEGAAPRAVAMGEAGSQPVPRLSTGLGELDRVLGRSEQTRSRAGGDAAGFVPGSAVLLGGAPGIGKSTLLLQAAGSLAGRGARVLYVSSEESIDQVRRRGERLGVMGGGVTGASGTVDPGVGERLFLLADTNLARIVEQARRVGPSLLIIDSVQMVYAPSLEAAPGSVAQLRRCGSDLVGLAKLSGMCVVLVGHVTKEGSLAGPKLLEHLVDAVLSFEGDRYHAHRLVRATKNRYGATSELGIFEMTGGGLRPAPEGAGVVAQEQQPRPGSVVCPVVSGTRCVLVEVQALTATGFLGAAKRKCSGLDPNRLAMVIAVLEQHAGLRLADRDVFASSVGGLRVAEPAADLALLLAIAGAHHRRPAPERTAAVGEVGLGGEVRPVAHLEQRVREAKRLGFARLIVPAAQAKDATNAGGPGFEAIGVRDIDRAIETLG